jgi:hypothetical protein
MNQPNRQFSVVDEEPTTTTERAWASPANDTATAMLALALRALSQRALVAAASLFSLITCGTVFWLALAVVPKPDIMQLVALGLYCAFVISLNFLVRRK